LDPPQAQRMLALKERLPVDLQQVRQFAGVAAIFCLARSVAWMTTISRQPYCLSIRIA